MKDVDSSDDGAFQEWNKLLSTSYIDILIFFVSS